MTTTRARIWRGTAPTTHTITHNHATYGTTHGWWWEVRTNGRLECRYTETTFTDALNAANTRVATTRLHDAGQHSSP